MHVLNSFLKLCHMLRCLEFTFWLYFWTCWFLVFWDLGIWGLWHFGTFFGFCDFWSLGLSDFCVVELSGFGTSDFESFLYLCTFGFELSDFGTWDFGIFWLFDFLFFCILDFVLFDNSNNKEAFFDNLCCHNNFWLLTLGQGSMLGRPKKPDWEPGQTRWCRIPGEAPPSTLEQATDWICFGTQEEPFQASLIKEKTSSENHFPPINTPQKLKQIRLAQSRLFSVCVYFCGNYN